MKKLAMVVVGLMLLLAACNTAQRPAPAQDQDGGQDVVSDEGSADVMEKAQGEAVVGAPKSLSEALSFSGSVICDFSDRDSNTAGTVYAKEGKMYAEYTFQGKKAYYIFDKVTMFIWGEVSPQAIKINVKEMEALVAQTPQAAQGQTYTADQWAAQNDGAQVTCKEASVADSKFVAPSGVQFTDLTAMLKQAQQGFPEGFQG